MKNSADIIIIGGGAIGLLTALELHDAGASVIILEKGLAVRESSWAGGGILSPLYPWRYPDSITTLAKYSQDNYERFSQHLLSETGIDSEYTRSGFLIETENELETAINWHKKHNVKLQKISASERHTLEPELNDHIDNTVWMPVVAQIRNPRFGKALLASCQNKNIAVIEQTEVTDINIIDSQNIKLSTASSDYNANKVIVACGAWTGDLLQSFSSPPAIAPVKGEMLIFRCPPKLIKRIHLSQDRYSIPRIDGRVLFGSTVQHTGYDKQISNDHKEELKNIAIQRFPVLKGYPIEHHWAGLRPGTPSGIPIISAHPEHPNLFINAGHFRNGLVLGLASAHLMRQIILQEKTFMDSYAFDWQNIQKSSS